MNNQSEYHFAFDLDKNGFPALTQKNVALIDFIIDNDSNYRYDADPQNADSTFNQVREIGESYDVDDIKRIVKKVDLQNSTHQSSEGPAGGSNGIALTAKHISEIDDFYTRIKNEDPMLVNELARAIPTRYTFSFASKYCCYISRYLYEGDGYSIYDMILCNILPYYAWVYCGIECIATKKSTIAKKYGTSWKGDYEGYRDLIDQIRDAAEKIYGYRIRRVDLDHLLWYYYKGDKDIKNDSKEIVYKSRITKALELVGKEESRIIFTEM